jgi:hypothetical protein
MGCKNREKRGKKYVKVEIIGPARCKIGWSATADEKCGVKKRPSVETEGRLTIACHMKNLQKIQCCISSSFFPRSMGIIEEVSKLLSQYLSKKNSMITNG